MKFQRVPCALESAYSALNIILYYGLEQVVNSSFHSIFLSIESLQFIYVSVHVISGMLDFYVGNISELLKYKVENCSTVLFHNLQININLIWLLPVGSYLKKFLTLPEQVHTQLFLPSCKFLR